MSGKILVVEDDPLSMKLLRMALRPYGYILLEATDAQKALRVAERDNPDLIIMDIQLPGMDGLEVTRRLRQRPASRHIPIIAVTAYAMKGDEEKIMGAGCDAYFPKPIDTRELPRVVARMLPSGEARP